MKTTFLNRKTLLLALILLVLALGFCSNTSKSAQGDTVSQGRTTFVFIDKTTSVDPDSFIMAKNRSWLQKVIKENALEAGDKIVLSFIYDNTSSASNKTEFLFHPPQMETRGMSSSEARIAKVKYDKRVRAYRKNFAEKIITQAFSHEPCLSGTDVVGSIQLLSNLSSVYSSHILKAYYFSDMQECSLFRYMYCGDANSKLKSFEQAQKMGEEDYQRIIQRYQLSTDCLKSISEITVIFPATELDSDEAFALLPQYWNSIFKDFGVPSINYY